jgi:hypothetical protein
MTFYCRKELSERRWHIAIVKRINNKTCLCAIASSIHPWHSGTIQNLHSTTALLDIKTPRERKLAAASIRKE